MAVVAQRRDARQELFSCLDHIEHALKVLWGGTPEHSRTTGPSRGRQEEEEGRPITEEMPR